jgi:hypothetical protein
MKKIYTEEQLKLVMQALLADAAGNAGFGKSVDRVEAHLVAVRTGVPDRLTDATFLKDLFDSPDHFVSRISCARDELGRLDRANHRGRAGQGLGEVILIA